MFLLKHETYLDMNNQEQLLPSTIDPYLLSRYASGATCLTR